jgi:hypothetical protein
LCTAVSSGTWIRAQGVNGDRQMWGGTKLRARQRALKERNAEHNRTGRKPVLALNALGLPGANPSSKPVRDSRTVSHEPLTVQELMAKFKMGETWIRDQFRNLEGVLRIPSGKREILRVPADIAEAKYRSFQNRVSASQK